nr:hypothetical protein HMPREF0014_01788 [Acinetobacter sp. RUH 2624]
MENTTNEYPTAVPAQVQPHQPGDQEKMHPEPEIIKASHKGSEKRLCCTKLFLKASSVI